MGGEKKEKLSDNRSEEGERVCRVAMLNESVI